MSSVNLPDDLWFLMVSTYLNIRNTFLLSRVSKQLWKIVRKHLLAALTQSMQITFKPHFYVKWANRPFAPGDLSSMLKIEQPMENRAHRLCHLISSTLFRPFYVYVIYLPPGYFLNYKKFGPGAHMGLVLIIDNRRWDWISSDNKVGFTRAVVNYDHHWYADRYLNESNVVVMMNDRSVRIDMEKMLARCSTKSSFASIEKLMLDVFPELFQPSFFEGGDIHHI